VIDEGVTPMDCGVRNSKARYYLLGGKLQFATFEVPPVTRPFKLVPNILEKLCTTDSIVDVIIVDVIIVDDTKWKKKIIKNNTSDDIRNCLLKLMQT